MADSLGDRMKGNYEDRYRIKLLRRIPVILRLDGKAFHTLTKQCDRPFDPWLQNLMVSSALEVCRQIQGMKCAYVQSDEVSILLTDFDKLTTEAWFDYNLQKMTSVSASIMSASFNIVWVRHKSGIGPFDCRGFNVPKEEVVNYFVWRQQDWARNSLSMFARSFFSHKELLNKNTNEIHDMLHERGESWANWAKLPDICKNGTFIFKEGRDLVSRNDVILTKTRDIIERYMIPEED